MNISDGFHDSFARISSRRSVRQKESFVCLFVRSFSRVSGSGESFSESFRLTIIPSFFKLCIWASPCYLKSV